MLALFDKLHYGARILRRNPGFSSVAVLTLALGLGANTAFFSVAHSALFRPLPYFQPDRLYTIAEARHQSIVSVQCSYPDYVDFTRMTKSFTAIAGYSGDAFTLVTGGEPRYVFAEQVTPNFFSTLGVKPVLGRDFIENEQQRDGPHVAILSHGFWQSEFGADPSTVGRVIALDNHLVTIVGILPETFEFAPARSAPIWVPLHPNVDSSTRRNLRWLRVVGRLAMGVTEGQGRAELNGIAAQLSRAYPKEDGSMFVIMVGLRDAVVGRVRPLLLILLGAVGLVLLITCANIANLLTTRGIGRQKELAVRSALGATRGDLIGQLLAESVVLSGAGATLGLIGAYWGVVGLVHAIPDNLLQFTPYFRHAGINPVVLVFLVATALFTTILFGLAPALAASQSALNERLKDEARGGTSRVHGRFRNALVISEIAMSFVLLAGAALMIQSLRSLLHQNPGFDISHVLTFNVNLPAASYPTAEGYPPKSPRAIRFEHALRDKLQSVPGVVNVGSASGVPASGGSGTIRFVIEGRATVTGQEDECDIVGVDANYFATMKIERGLGRLFEASDSLDSPPVAIVNREFVRAYLGNDNPLGKRVRFTYDARNPYLEIVGVVGDTAQDDVALPSPPVVYVSNDQDSSRQLNFFVRTAGEPLSFLNSARAALHEIDPELPLVEPTTIEQIVSNSPSVFLRRYPSYLIGSFAGVALILAIVGLYGLISYTVVLRTREIGIRITVGAQPGDILRMILRQAIGTSLAGIGIGVLVGLGVTRLMASLLYGVKPHAWSTFAGSAVLLILAALAAALIPVKSAMGVDPIRALGRD
jgi:predicted permease